MRKHYTPSQLTAQIADQVTDAVAHFFYKSCTRGTAQSLFWQDSSLSTCHRSGTMSLFWKCRQHCENGPPARNRHWTLSLIHFFSVVGICFAFEAVLVRPTCRPPQTKSGSQPESTLLIPLRSTPHSPAQSTRKLRKTSFGGVFLK